MTTEQHWLGNDSPVTDITHIMVEAYRKRRVGQIEDFLIAVFNITEEEQTHIREVQDGMPADTRDFNGITGKPPRAWSYERVIRRMETQPLPPNFWNQVIAHEMLEDPEGQALVQAILDRKEAGTQ